MAASGRVGSYQNASHAVLNASQTTCDSDVKVHALPDSIQNIQQVELLGLCYKMQGILFHARQSGDQPGTWPVPNCTAAKITPVLPLHQSTVGGTLASQNTSLFIAPNLKEPLGHAALCVLLHVLPHNVCGTDRLWAAQL